MRRVVVCLCLICLLPVFCLAGPLYKWVDDRGVVHYSDRRPGSSESVRNFEDRSSADAKSAQPAGATYREVDDRADEVETAAPEMEENDEVAEDDNAADLPEEVAPEDAEQDNEER